MKTMIDILVESFLLTFELLVASIIFLIIGRSDFTLISGGICFVVFIIQLIVYLRKKKIDRTIEEYNQNIEKWMNKK